MRLEIEPRNVLKFRGRHVVCIVKKKNRNPSAVFLRMMRKNRDERSYRRSSLLLLAIARSFRKWDIRSWKFTGHEDTVLIKSSKIDVCVPKCVRSFVRACMREWIRGEKRVYGRANAKERRKQSPMLIVQLTLSKRYSGKCGHGFALSEIDFSF